MLAVLTLLVIFIGQSKPEVPPSERRVLMQLYNSTGGERWTNRSGWGTSSSVCDWYGVRCEFQGGDPARAVVAGLSLDLNNLEGELPARLGELSHLKYLGLVGNKLRGRLPESLLQRFDRHSIQLNASRNTFTNTVGRVAASYRSSGTLCSSTEDTNYTLEIDEAKDRATFQSVRCVDEKSRNTYCLVRESTAPSLLRLSRALNALEFAKFQAKYESPFMTITHGAFLTTEAVWGDGTKKSVETYSREGPIEVWTAQQLFLSLIVETSWERESRKSKCDFEK